MAVILIEKITPKQLEQVSRDLAGYIKFVVDIEKGALAAGGTRHVEAEQKLLETGSKQQNLWGGGWDRETDELDFDSMINIRPDQNASREVLSEEIRSKMIDVVNQLLRS